MNRVSSGVTLVALILGAVFVVQSSAQSTGGPYQINPVVIAGGGSAISGGTFQITSTLGQPATSRLSGASYIIVDGFWAPVGGVFSDVIFANGFESP